MLFDQTEKSLALPAKKDSVSEVLIDEVIGVTAIAAAIYLTKGKAFTEVNGLVADEGLALLREIRLASSTGSVAGEKAMLGKLSSLVDKKLVVDLEGDGADFKTVYPKADPKAAYTVTEDNQGFTRDGSGIRILMLKDAAGNEISGNASRFMSAPTPDLGIVGKIGTLLGRIAPKSMGKWADLVADRELSGSEALRGFKMLDSLASSNMDPAYKSVPYRVAAADIRTVRGYTLSPGSAQTAEAAPHIPMDDIVEWQGPPELR